MRWVREHGDEDDDGGNCGVLYRWDTMIVCWVVVGKYYRHRRGYFRGYHQRNVLLLRGWCVGCFVGTGIVARVDVQVVDKNWRCC